MKFTKINKDFIGGESYLKIHWKILGSKKNGYLAHIGIADLSKKEKTETLESKYGETFQPLMTIGDKEILSSWNDKFFKLKFIKNNFYNNY